MRVYKKCVQCFHKLRGSWFQSLYVLSHPRFWFTSMFPVAHWLFLWSDLCCLVFQQPLTCNFPSWAWEAGELQVNFHGSGTLGLPWQLLPPMPHTVLPHWRRRKRDDGLLPSCLGAPPHCPWQKERESETGRKRERGRKEEKRWGEQVGTSVWCVGLCSPHQRSSGSTPWVTQERNPSTAHIHTVPRPSAPNTNSSGTEPWFT